MVRYEVKMKWVFPIEQNTFDQSDNISCRVVPGTDNRNMNNLQNRQIEVEKEATFVCKHEMHYKKIIILQT